MPTDYSPELMDAIGFATWDTMLDRARIEQLGDLAAGYAKPKMRGHIQPKGNPHTAYMFARMAAHQARILFPDIFLWKEERYGQQLTIEAA